MKDFFGGVLLIAFAFALGYGIWSGVRIIHYKFSYAGKVEQTICEMVKQEYLKKPCKK